MNDRLDLVPLWIRAIFFGIPALLTLTWGWTHSGLYRIVADLQIAAFGAYYLALTGLVTFVLCLVPSAVALHALASRYENAPTDEARRAAADRRYRSAEWNAWLMQRQRRVAFMGAGVVLVLVGAYQGAQGILAGEQVSVSASSFARLEDPPGSWVWVEGARLRAEDTLTFEDDRRERLFVPVDTGSPRIALFVEMSPFDLEQHAIELDSGRLPGMLTESGLPGVVRDAYDREGMLADRHWVLDFRDSPQARIEFGGGLATGGFALMLITAVVWLILDRR